MDKSTNVLLNDGHQMPIIGFGVFQSGEDTYEAVSNAIKSGYRHIDTAMIYKNEEAVGKAIKDSGVNREELFITTKLWNQDVRDGNTRKALQTSLDKLGVEYIDLYLIHWPVEGSVEAYKEMEILQEEGLIRSIGVSNFKKHHLEDLLKEVTVIPAVDQLEFNPSMQDDEVKDYCRDKGIILEAYSPLGRGTLLDNSIIKILAQKHEKTPAQIILRWLVQKRIVPIPKSVHSERIKENINIFDFNLLPDEIHEIDRLNTFTRTGIDPDNFDF